MEPNTNNMGGMPENSTPSMPPKPASPAGTITAVVLIVAVLLIGGFYFWGERAAEPMETSTVEQSDATADIEADLNSTDVENVDYDLNPENFNAS